MGGDTKIQWTDATWNPVRGCSRVSEGCRHCYAEGVAARFSGKDPAGKPLAYYGLARQSDNGPRWTGKLVMVPEHLDDPIRWRKPRRIFVNSMSDLFHEKLGNDQIASVFRVMLAAPQHTYQVLTKRAERMKKWVDWFLFDSGIAELPGNIHLGISAEDQPTFDDRTRWLEETKCALRFVSAEPLLGRIDARRPLQLDRFSVSREWIRSGFRPELAWIIVGGESGNGARPFDVDWARLLVEQGRAAGVAVFVKQLGAKPWDSTGKWPRPERENLHGPEIETWGADFAVREFPSASPWTVDFPCAGFKGCENRVEEEGAACGHCGDRNDAQNAGGCPACGGNCQTACG